MLVEKEIIQKAKENIGEENAALIADALHLEKYDERNKKALCPFHAEDTPSFIYNSKAYSFHCFGCGKNVDLIDALMHTGHTYLSAVETLFDKAKIKYAFGEKGIRDKREYRYPKEPQELIDEKIIEYCATRKISKSTLDYAGIRQDENGNIAFPYYDTNDVLKMVKYRPARKVSHGENKMWCQKDADTEPLLFNMNKINASEPLLICEGEMDCLSVIQCGITNVVSVPLGAKNLQWIEHNFDWLEQFDSIIFCGDNDEVGRKMVKEASVRLGSWRIKTADLPVEYVKEDGKSISVKDANEVLYWFGESELHRAIDDAKDTPVLSVVDFSEIPDIDINDLDGVKIGLQPFDEQLNKLFFSTVTVVSGKPAAGKTSFLYQLVSNAIDDNIPCWIYSRELSGWLSRSWFMSILAGSGHVVETVNRFTGAREYRIPQDIKQKISEHYFGMIKFYRDDFPNDADSIIQAMTDCRRKFGDRLFIIDNLMTVELKGGDDKNEQETIFMNRLIQFASKYDAAVLLCAHPRKSASGAITTDMDMDDVAGSATIMNLAHRAIALRRVTKQEAAGVLNRKGDGWVTPPNPYSVMVKILKDRLFGKTNFVDGIYYDVPSRRFYTNEKEWGKQYKWDKSENNVLPECPLITRDKEVFGVVNSAS